MLTLHHQCWWALVIALSFNRLSGVLGHNNLAALRIQTKAAALSRDSVSRLGGGTVGCPWGLLVGTACKEPNIVGCCGGGTAAGGSSSVGNVARGGGALNVATSFRGGASANEVEDDSEDEYDDEYDEEEEEEDEEEEEEDDALSEEEEYDDYDDEEEQEDEDETVPAEASAPDVSVTTDYDEPLVPSPFQQMGTTIGIMMLCRKIDLFDPKVIKMARFAFIAYLVTTQLFLLYVRAKARSLNDRTPITIKNPISSVIQSQLPTGGSSGGNNADMVKNLANQFLSSQSTIMEYDLKQAKSMSGSTLFPMVFLWFIHFKMGQVQPLFYQTASGVVNLVYSPLFQVYVLGRNLERPFKSSNKQNVALEAMQKRAAAARQEAGDEEEEGDVKVSTTEKVGEEIGEEETEVDVDDVSSDDEEEDEEEGDEYDDYDYSEED